MQKFPCLLFVLKRSFICYYITCMNVPLIIIKNKKTIPILMKPGKVKPCYRGKISFVQYHDHVTDL